MLGADTGYGRPVHRSVARLIIGAVACAALVLPSSAGAALVGPPGIATSGWDGAYGCFGFPACTFANLRLPDGAVRSPISGTITRWRVNVEETSPNTAGPLRLEVLRRTADKPGLAADKFKAISRSAKTTTDAGLNVLQASLPIRKGDFIGIADLSEQTYIRNVEGSGIFGVFAPPLAPGDPGSAPDEFPSVDAYLLFSASVRG
jgi:hypothetical protein